MREDNILGKYVFGSRLYGTANEIKNILERYKCYDVELYQELKSLL